MGVFELLMDRRKDTNIKGSKLPQEYLKMVEDVFNKNFAKHLKKEKDSKEVFVCFGEIFPDELILALSLKNKEHVRLTTCYASVDFPPSMPQAPAGGKRPSTSDTVQHSVSQCVDAIAGFFDTFFNDGRPVDYDNEYAQGWMPVEIDKKTRVFVRINHDNLELEAQADAILAEDEENQTSSKKKKTLH